VLLLGGASFMALMVLWTFGFNPVRLFERAVDIRGAAVMGPGGLITDPISAISTGIALMFGTAGLPHILMRFFTVRDAPAAGKSVFYATGFIGYFYILTFIIGFGAMALLSLNPDYLARPIAEALAVNPQGAVTAAQTSLRGTNNMAAIHLAHAVGGDLFLGFI